MSFNQRRALPDSQIHKKCKTCGADRVRRTGSYSDFYGCINYGKTCTGDGTSPVLIESSENMEMSEDSTFMLVAGRIYDGMLSDYESKDFNESLFDSISAKAIRATNALFKARDQFFGKAYDGNRTDEPEDSQRVRDQREQFREATA